MEKEIDFYSNYNKHNDSNWKATYGHTIIIASLLETKTHWDAHQGDYLVLRSMNLF